MSIVSKVSIVPETIVRSMVLIMSVTVRSIAVGVSEMAILSIVESMGAVVCKTMTFTVIGIVSKAKVRIVMIIMSIAMIVSMVAIVTISMIEAMTFVSEAVIVAMVIMSPSESKLMWILAKVTKIVMATMSKTISVEGVVSIAMPVSVMTFMTKAKVRPMV